MSITFISDKFLLRMGFEDKKPGQVRVFIKRAY